MSNLIILLGVLTLVSATISAFLLILFMINERGE